MEEQHEDGCRNEISARNLCMNQCCPRATLQLTYQEASGYSTALSSCQGPSQPHSRAAQLPSVSNGSSSQAASPAPGVCAVVSLFSVLKALCLHSPIWHAHARAHAHSGICLPSLPHAHAPAPSPLSRGSEPGPRACTHQEREPQALK